MTELDARHDPASPDRGPSRRRVLVAGGVAAAAAAVTAACGGTGGGTSSGAATQGGAASSPAAGVTLAESDVPVGGGTILTDQKVVVTQPTAGQFKAFTAVCTHMGCTVASVANGTITCPCHGSQYSIKDGSVVGGPAPAPLAPVPLTISGTTITVA
ncbi:MAG TPA: Rieske (2Fe-2S) protein [Candidatus Angelobacter sp.]|nr:Rieske (2Fe-2S) protein [Candidatus Angelobacter sp.]